MNKPNFDDDFKNNDLSKNTDFEEEVPF
jgi:hypothetical protein